ncbi:MAG: alpha/beta fold hydrolase [Solirubrobacteraceae bacterium]|nr:alpha/beta fold hydrolase [Patulibacter sp.]
MSTPTDQPAPTTIVFIHGLWMTPLSWEHWIARYEALGYTVIAPSWPGFEKSVDELNRDHSTITPVTAGKVLDHYETIIRALDAPPIIIGHSFGGGFTEILLDRGLGAAGVAIAPAPLRGIRELPLSVLRAASPVLGNPLNYRKAVPLNEKQFRYAFGNTVSEAENKAAWERYAVPAASKVLFAGAAANLLPGTPLKVDWKKADRAPLLLVGGGQDHIVPSKLVAHAARLYGKGTAVTEFKNYPERSHLTVGEPGWEAVADHAIQWVQAKVGGPVAA